MGAETRIEWCDATLNLWWGRLVIRTEVKSWRSTLAKISKKAAGRLLDGRTWDGYPEVAS